MTNTKRERRFSIEHDEPSKTPRQPRVLVVDDDRDTVLSLMMLLREEGHEVRGVHLGRQVMGAVLDFDPDAVVLDIHLPGSSGWEVARTIRDRRGRERPMLIGISGEYKQGADKILSKILGFDHYLLKPYAPADLLALLEPLRTTPLNKRAGA
jgi:DNA-binding response OmpR family regulator